MDACGKVQIVSTGGTFEKIYNPPTESMTLSAPSCIPDILAAAGVERAAFHSLMQIDSQDMTDADRRRVLAYVAALEGERFVVVHGTSTMVETARLFAAELAGKGVYVFTGAMVPFSHSPIEASFNLGGALALARSAAPGIYIHMHGQVFDPAHTAKDVARARFVAR